MLEMMTGSILKKITEPGLEIDPNVFQKLLASDGAAGDAFGKPVVTTADGTTIVIGASGDDDKGGNSGSVYVFTKQVNGSYLQTQKLVPSDGAALDLFGNSVAISGDGSAVIVGAHTDDDKGDNSGSAYIFTKQAGGSYLETQKLLASDGAANDQFGWSVATSGDGSTIVIAAYRDSDNGTDSGSAYIFTKQANGSYLETQKLVASDSAASDLFGLSVAISGDGSTVIAGASYDDDQGVDSGSVYVFSKQANGSYLETQKLLASDGAAYDEFGGSVAISGDGSTVIVSAHRDDDKVADSGSAYVFTKQANGSYLQTQKLVASDGEGSDFFGWSIAISSDGITIIVGAYGDDDKGLTSGSVYVFTKQANGSYLQTQKLVASDGAGGDQFGRSVAVSQTSVIVGGFHPFKNGAVYVF